MKTASLLLALGAAQLGFAAPVPQSWEDLILPEGLSTRSLTPRSIPVTRVSRTSTGHAERDDARRSSLNSGIAFDNRPLSPSGTVPASVALAAARPLHTTFLQGLTREKATVTVIVDVEDDGTPVASAVPAAVAHHYPAYEAVTDIESAIKPVEVVEVIEVAEVEVKHWATPARASLSPSQSAGEMLESLYADYRPCWKKTKARVQRLVRGKADLIVVAAVLALAVVLWTLETTYGVAYGVRRNWFGCRQGTIRLEGGEREPCQGVEWEKTRV